MNKNDEGGGAERYLVHIFGIILLVGVAVFMYSKYKEKEGFDASFNHTTEDIVNSSRISRANNPGK